MRRSTWFSFPRVDLAKGVPQHTIGGYADAVNRQVAPVLPGVQFTEKNWRWVMLYDDTRKGQLDPKTIRHMRNEDREYLAGSPTPHPDIDVDEGAKLQGNVARATRELQRRYLVRTTLLSVLLAAFVSTTITLVTAAIT